MRIVTGLSYRHVSGYLKVVGRTQRSAERNSKAVGTHLIENLPSGTIVKPSRYKGVENNLHTYEIPVLLNRPGVRKVLAALALKGML